MKGMPRGRGIAAAAAVSACLLVPAGSAAAASEDAPDGARVSFYAGLQRDDAGARKALRAATDPQSHTYRQFPARNAIRTRFGATRTAVAALRRSASSDGLRVRLDPSGVFATISGTAARMGRWLGSPVTVEQGDVSGLALQLYTSSGSPPRAARAGITEWFPLYLRAAAGSDSVAAAGAKRKPFAGINRGTPDSCLGGIQAQLDDYIYSYNQLRTAYGLDTLPTGPAVGAAARVVVMSQGDGFAAAALKQSAACFDRPALATRRVPVPGLSGALPQGDEGNLDLQVVQSVLPAGSTATVIESAAADPRDFVDWSVAFGLPKLPDVVTVSYGVCEQLARKGPGRSAVPMTESVLLRLGLAGTSVFASAGDRGSSNCINNDTGKGPTRLAVDYPASSHFVTGVGGSRIRLDNANRRDREVVWNDSNLLPPLGPLEGAGGGGRSVLWERPWWQDARATRSATRAVPDVVAHASLGPGWPVWSRSGAQFEIDPVAGTSAATPFVAATFGLLAAHERLRNRPPFGAVQPLLYQLHRTAPRSLYDITRGSNDLKGEGCCNARVGYDEASGLGAPRFDVIADNIVPPAGPPRRRGNG